jgi:hypothetical protein
MIPACTDTGKPSTPAMGSVTEGRNSDIADNQSLFNSANYGHYVSDGYLNRDQGYDWVSVYVKERSPYQVAISVRSRIDRKKPTCTFDGVASIIDQNTLMINSDFSMQFTFESDSLSIQGKTEEDNNRMYFYCSGGATLAGKYIMIDGPPDPDQVDQTAYFNTLNWNDLFFQVVATNEMITVDPPGIGNCQ